MLTLFKTLRFFTFSVTLLLTARGETNPSDHPLDKIQQNENTEIKWDLPPPNKQRYYEGRIQRKLPYHFEPSPGEYKQSIINEKGKTLYSVKYTFGRFANRVHPSLSPNRKPKDHFMILMGGSNTFGQWVPDKATLGNQLQKILNANSLEVKVTTLALLGSSLSSIYNLLKSIDINKAFPQERGTLIYNFFYVHINRDNCLPPAILWSQGKHPWNELENGNVVNKGKCNDQLSIKWQLLAQNYLLPILSYIDLFLPPKKNFTDFITKENALFTFHILKAIHTLLEDKGKKIKTYVLINNIRQNNYPKNSIRPLELFKRKIEESEFELIPHDDNYLPSRKEKLTFKYDGHYNEKGYRVLSDLIYKGLLKLNWGNYLNAGNQQKTQKSGKSND